MPLIINGERIEDAFVEQEFSSIKASFEANSGNTCCCDRDDEFRGYARDNIVARVLITQAAQQTVDPISPAEIDAAFESVKREHGGDAEFYAAVGATPDQDDLIRRDLETNLRVEKLLDGICGPEVEPNEAELRADYERNIERFMIPEKIRAVHILKNPERGEDREAVYQQLRGIREQLLDGADFESLAREHSDKAREAAAATAEGRNEEGHDGIDLGWFQRGELMDEFEIVAFSLRVGELSSVFSTPFGFHLVRLTDRQAAAPKPFDDVRDEVLEQWHEQRRTERIRAFVDQAKAGATIEAVDDPDA